MSIKQPSTVGLVCVPSLSWALAQSALFAPHAQVAGMMPGPVNRQMDDYVTHTCTHTPSQEHRGYWCSEHFLVLPSVKNWNGDKLLESTDSVR